MWRSVAVIVGLALSVAGCTWGANEGAGTVMLHDTGVLQGRVFTTACGISSTCPRTPYRGEIVFCEKRNQLGPCPAARVDAQGRYRIELRPHRYWLVPAPGKHNVVIVTPRWVLVVGGQTRTLSIDGGSSEK